MKRYGWIVIVIIIAGILFAMNRMYGWNPFRFRNKTPKEL